MDRDKGSADEFEFNASGRKNPEQMLLSIAMTVKMRVTNSTQAAQRARKQNSKWESWTHEDLLDNLMSTTQAVAEEMRMDRENRASHGQGAVLLSPGLPNAVFLK